MKTYKFTDADGKAQEVAVTDNVYATMQELDEYGHRSERRETRRCQSLEQSVDNGWDVADPNADIETIIDKKERYKKLYAALNTLPKQQQRLIYLVFFKGVSQIEIARQEGVTKVAIHLRLQVILQKLKEILN